MASNLIRIWLAFFILCLSVSVMGQSQNPADYGFRHIQASYNGDTVDILIKSAKGEEQKRKPLFLFCQGSLPIPLIITYYQNGKQGIYHVPVFDTDSLVKTYHIVLIGKPFVPLAADSKSLNKNLTYSDASGAFPSKYIERNLLDYYVNRNRFVIRFLQQQSWVSSRRLVVAGHSEGSTIAAKLASVEPAVTELIYSGGNPMGRIVSMIEEARKHETDSMPAEPVFTTWQRVVANPDEMDASHGDANKATYGFSTPPIRYLDKLRIPVLVCYGTKDAGAPFNDYLRVEMIRQKRTNFSFKAYIGTEHNFFPVKPNGEVDYDVFNWNRVAEDWRRWLSAH